MLLRYLKDDLANIIWEMTKFAMVGCSNVAINLVIYWFLMAVGFHYVTAYGIGYLISIINAYFMSNKFVFKAEEGEDRSRFKSMAKVFAIYVGTFLLSEFLLTIQIVFLQLDENMAPIINLLFTSPISFFLNKFWAFGNKKVTV